MFLQMVVRVLATRVGALLFTIEKTKIGKAIYSLKSKKLEKKAMYNWKNKN